MLQTQRSHWIFVMGWLTFGGAQRQSLYLADYLLNLGAKVTFVGLSSPGILIEECKARQIDCHLFDLDLRGSLSFFKLVSLIRFGIFIKRLKPTYLAPYCMPPNVACGLIWRFTGARDCVWQQRDEGRLRQNQWLEALAIRLTPKFVSNSIHASDWLNQTLHVPRRKISIIRNGIGYPGEVERGLTRQKLGISAGRLVAVKIANIHRYKDHLSLLKAWLEMISTWDNSDLPLLILAGKHEDAYQQVRDFIDHNSLHESILCPGIVRDVSSLLADADIMAFSSVNEGCPNAVLEGMMAGLTIVANDTRAIREAVGESGIGLLSPPGDTVQFAKNLKAALTDPVLRANQAELNVKRVRSCFSINTMCRETMRVYHIDSLDT
jgi:glycosyltransferase involved in cell wall biosynthesis